MGKISGNLTEDSRIIIYDTETATNVIDEIVSAGAYEFPGLTSYDKIITATNSATGEALAYGKVSPASEPPIEAVYNIGASYDDGIVDEGTYYGPTSRFGCTDQPRHGWLRYQIPIPQGSSIEYAYIKLVDVYDNSGAITINIYANDADDAARPTSNADYYTKILTGNYTSWAVPGQTGVGGVKDTPSIIDVVEEVINRPGWAANNYIMFMFKYSAGSGPGARYWHAYETEGHPAARLYIRFVAP